MYEDLIKQLREKAARFDYDGWVDTAAILKEAADAIEELAAENKEIVFRANQLEAINDALYGETGACDAIIAAREANRWIPVTERLPESGQSCLCYYNGGQRGQLSWISLDRYIDSDGCSGFYPCRKDAFHGTVTHWMPLPEPPKEETE